LEDNIQGLLDVPGPAVIAYASLSKLKGKPQIEVFLDGQKRQHVEAVASLLLYDRVKNTTETLDGISEHDLLYFKFCMSEIAETRELNDFSYVDEIRCLQMGHGAENALSILETPFSKSEDLTFEALQLSGSSGGR
jgi:hypothetical protein